MDPLSVGAAFAVAQASVGAVKEAIKLGKDIYQVSGDLTKFFSAQTQINTELKKAEEAKKQSLQENRHQDYYQLTAAALDIAIKQKKMIQDEAEIKTLLIWSGNGDVYHAMVKERLRMEKEQALAESKELFEKVTREKRKQELKELQAEIALVVAVIVLVVAAFTILVRWGIEKGLWASGVNDPRIVYQTQRIK
jgi:lipopolysaccharide export LptBFGC system permease protein LptF